MPSSASTGISRSRSPKAWNCSRDKRKTEEGEHRVRSAWSPTRSMARTPCVGARGLRTRSTPMRIRVEGVVGNLDHIVPNVVS
jgi:hypothetical protein